MKPVTLALALALAAGCGKSVAVAVNVVSVSCSGGDVLAADAGVQFLRFTVVADGGTVGPPETVAVASQTLQLPQTPLGTLQVNVDALSSNSASSPILAQGSSGPFVLDGSQSQATITVFVRAVDRSGYTSGAKSPTQCTAMTTPRAYHGQALLPDGKVLIYGGVVYGASSVQDGGLIDWTQALGMPPAVACADEKYLETAELYDPQSGTFSGAGAWSPSGSTPSARASSQIIPFSNGAAVVVGGVADPGSIGQSDAVGTPLLPAVDDGIFSPSATPPWANSTTFSPHANGCLAYDANGDALVAGGYTSGPSTTPVAESFETSSWPPFPHQAGAFPSNIQSPNGALGDLACGGFDGATGLFRTLIAEAGGVWIDGSGNAWIEGTYYLEQFAGSGSTAGFSPYLLTSPQYGCTNPPCVLGQQLAAPRARAKAAPMIITEQTALDGGVGRVDALLVTGGLTCTPATLDATACQPPFANGAGSGALAGTPDSYFWNDAGTAGAPLDVGTTTELIDFPLNLTSGQQSVSAAVPSAFMSTERIDHCAVPLPDGRVVLIGGLGGSTDATFGSTGSIEIAYDNPGSAPASSLPKISMHEAAGNLVTPRAGMACTLLHDGSILVTGGLETVGPLNPNGTQQVKTLSSAELYRPLPLAQ